MTIQALITTLAKETVNKIVPYPSNAILNYLIAQVEEQQKTLEKVAQRQKHHMTVPFRNGLLYLQELKYISDEVRQRENLTKALDAFITISHLPTSDFALVPVMAQFYVGVCYELLLDTNNALRWYKKAYHSTIEYKFNTKNSTEGLLGIRNLFNTGWTSKWKNTAKLQTELESLINYLPNLINSKGEFRAIHTLEHPAPVTCVTFSPDGLLLVSGAQDGVIRLWEVKTGRMIQELKDKAVRIYDVSFSPDGSLLATGEMGGAKVRDIKSGKVILNVFDEAIATTNVDFSPDGQLLACGTVFNVVSVWKIRNGKLVREFKGHKESGLRGIITDVAFSPDGLFIASSSNCDSKVRIWKVKTGRTVRLLTGTSYGSGGIKSIAFSSNGLFLVTGSEHDEEICVWNLRNGNIIQHVIGEKYGHVVVTFSPEGLFLVSGRYSKAKVLNVSSGEVVQELVDSSQGFIESIDVSPDGTIIAIAKGGDDIPYSFAKQDGLDTNHSVQLWEFTSI